MTDWGKTKSERGKLYGKWFNRYVTLSRDVAKKKPSWRRSENKMTATNKGSITELMGQTSKEKKRTNKSE